MGESVKMDQTVNPPTSQTGQRNEIPHSQAAHPSIAVAVNQSFGPTTANSKSSQPFPMYPTPSMPASMHPSIPHSQSVIATAQSDKKEPDILFPVANISRIMKKVIPPNATITKDCLLAVQQCVCDFVSFISSEAGVHCLQEKRKTVSGDDITFALNNMGFDNYSEVLQIYLQKYRESKEREEQRPGKKTKYDKQAIIPTNNNNSHS